MLCVRLDGVHRLSAREPHQLGRCEGGHVPRGAGADPDERVLEQGAVEKDGLDLAQRKRRHRARLVPGRFLNLFCAGDPDRGTTGCLRHLAPVGPAIPGYEHQNRAAVTVEDERLDDLRQLAADRLGRLLGCGRAGRELLDPRLGARISQVHGDPLDRLRPGAVYHARKGSQREQAQGPQRRLGWTVILNLAVALFALESVVEHRTSVRPNLKKPPERGLQAAPTEPSTASFARTV